MALFILNTWLWSRLNGSFRILNFGRNACCVVLVYLWSYGWMLVVVLILFHSFVLSSLSFLSFTYLAYMSKCACVYFCICLTVGRGIGLGCGEVIYDLRKGKNWNVSLHRNEVLYFQLARRYIWTRWTFFKLICYLNIICIFYLKIDNIFGTKLKGHTKELSHVSVKVYSHWNYARKLVQWHLSIADTIGSRKRCPL